MTRAWLRRLFMLAVVVVMMVGLFSVVSGAAEPASDPQLAPERYPFSDRYPATVTLASTDDLAVLRTHRIDVGDIQPASGTRTGPSPDAPFTPLVATVYVNDKEADLLARHGLSVQPIPNEGLRAHRLYGPGSGAPNAWPTYEQFVARMQALATSHPDIVRVQSIGQSVQGRGLWVLKISDNPDVEEDEPEFKYSSSHHGDETVGIELTLRLAELLANNYGSDPALTELVDEMEIWLWPIYNPDGYVAGSRENAHGQDLNRDFPDRIADPVDDPAGREPETQAAMVWGYDHRFVMGANYHGGAAVVNVPWDALFDEGDPEYAPDDDAFMEYGVGYSSRNTRIWNGGFPQGITRGWDWYFVYGGMQDWAYHWQGEHHVTIELGDTKSPPYEQMGVYWAENQAAMLWWMERVLRGARGVVTDATTGEPQAATVDAVQIGKPVRTDLPAGDYHRLLLPGDYTLVAAAPCYESQTAPVTVVDGPAAVVNFALLPAETWTVQGTVTELGTGRPLSATIEFEGTGLVAYSSPATGHYALDICAGTYTMTVSAAGHRPAGRLVVVDGDQTQDFELEPAPCTLLVDDDTGDNYENWFESALDATGQEYDVWTVSGSGSPTAADLAAYDRLVWLTGDDYGSTLTGSDQAALSTYLDGGGRLFLSGQDIGYDIGSTAFYADYLHADFLADDTNSYVLTGLDYLSGVDVNIQGGDGAGNQNYPSNITTANGSVAIFDYPSYAYGGVAYQDETYAVAYFSFGFEAINNQADRTEVMSRTLSWLGGCEQSPYYVVAGDSLAAGDPGETVTHTFAITNVGTVADSYTISLQPGAWEAELLDASVGPLQPLEDGQVQVTVHIPAAPGESVIGSDTLTLVVTSDTDPEVVAWATGTTHALGEVAVDLAAGTPSGGALPGQVVTYSLTLTNAGTVADRYSLHASGNLWPVEVVPAQTPVLAPGESASVWVYVAVPAGPMGQTDAVTIRAASGWNPAVYAEQVLLTRRGWRTYLPLIVK